MLLYIVVMYVSLKSPEMHPGIHGFAVHLFVLAEAMNNDSTIKELSRSYKFPLGGIPLCTQLS